MSCVCDRRGCGFTMTEPVRGFETAEFRRRVARAHELMEVFQLDALLLTTEADVRYFSGFLTPFWESPTRPWFLVLPASADPSAIIPEIGLPLMENTWIGDIRSWASPRPEDEGVTLLAQALESYSRVGLPMGPETTLRMPLGDYAVLRKALPGTRFVDAGEVVGGMRRVKSEAEIEKIRHICSIASRAFDRMGELVAEGQPLAELFRRFKIELLELGADDVPYLVGASSPGGYSDVISPPDRRPIQAGDLLMMDTGAVFDGYFCDFDRNYAVGRADETTKRAYEALYRATERGLEVVAPGVRCAEVFEAMADVISSSGYEMGNVGRMGHGLGMQLTETPSLTATDRTVLTEGMVMTLEPGLEIEDGRGMVHEENLVVRASGPELLSHRAPETLPIISI